MSRKQLIPLDYRSTKCVPPHPAVHSDTLCSNRAFVGETSLSDPFPEKDPLSNDEMAALRAFFQLLSQWDETLKGEIQHE